MISTKNRGANANDKGITFDATVNLADNELRETPPGNAGRREPHGYNPTILSGGEFSMSNNVKSYAVIQDGDRYTIGQWDETYKAYIVNDGICQYYWWPTFAAAQAAADAYNVYDGCEWLGQHGYGNDRISDDDPDTEMVELYRLFNAVDAVDAV